MPPRPSSLRTSYPGTVGDSVAPGNSGPAGGSGAVSAEPAPSGRRGGRVAASVPTAGDTPAAPPAGATRALPPQEGHLTRLPVQSLRASNASPQLGQGSSIIATSPA